MWLRGYWFKVLDKMSHSETDGTPGSRIKQFMCIAWSVSFFGQWNIETILHDIKKRQEKGIENLVCATAAVFARWRSVPFIDEVIYCLSGSVKGMSSWNVVDRRIT